MTVRREQTVAASPHGTSRWDLATAVGRPYPGDDPALAEAVSVAYRWADTVAEQNPDGVPGLFGRR